MPLPQNRSGQAISELFFRLLHPMVGEVQEIFRTLLIEWVPYPLPEIEGLLVPPFSPSGFLRKPLRQSISLPFAQQHYSYAEKDRMGRPTGRNPGRKTWYSGHCSREKSGYTETRDDRGELRGSNLPLLRGRSCPEPEP